MSDDQHPSNPETTRLDSADLGGGADDRTRQGGKKPDNSVRGKRLGDFELKGWFAPKVAAVINRKEGQYTIAPSEKAGATKVNSEPLTAVRELQEGDEIVIGGITMQFHFRE